MLGKQDTHGRKEEENLRRDGPSMANSGPFSPQCPHPHSPAPPPAVGPSQVARAPLQHLLGVT